MFSAWRTQESFDGYGPFPKVCNGKDQVSGEGGRRQQ